jgi:hypothetical protein
MNMHTQRTCTFLLFLLTGTCLQAQVQVSKEPRHKPVLENKYFRLLDVWLPPGDTTQYHVHSTPSAFLQLAGGAISSQVKGDKWVKEQTVPGKTWYRSFTPDSMIHRVCNADTIPFHVTDMELLAGYNNPSTPAPLPFTILWENEKAIAYQVSNASLDGQIIQGRGPLMAQLVTGEILYHNIPSDERKNIKAGQYLYIQPGTYFNLLAAGTANINLVIFELK